MGEALALGDIRSKSPGSEGCADCALTCRGLQAIFILTGPMPKYSCIGKRRPLSPLALCFIKDMPSRSRGAMRPSFDRIRPRKREGAGNAGCTLHPRSRAQRRVECAHEHTGSAEASGIPCAMALRLISRSPRRRIRLVTVVDGFCSSSTPVGFEGSHRRLGTSNGCQNHTVLPYAKNVVRPARP